MIYGLFPFCLGLIGINTGSTHERTKVCRISTVFERFIIVCLLVCLLVYLFAIYLFVCLIIHLFIFVVIYLFADYIILFYFSQGIFGSRKSVFVFCSNWKKLD